MSVCLCTVWCGDGHSVCLCVHVLMACVSACSSVCMCVMMVMAVQEDLMLPSLFICSECKEIEEDRSNVATCAECGVGSK